ncbi:MAG: hypothetical protein ACKVVP_08045, partial [Chloroflexota bacterium]
ASLFEACPQVPDLIIAMSNEVHPRLFIEDIVVSVPVCRVSSAEDTQYADGESPEMLSPTVHLFWVSQPPAGDSPARRVLDTLHARQLTVEPFERAAQGLKEAFLE